MSTPRIRARDPSLVFEMIHKLNHVLIRMDCASSRLMHQTKIACDLSSNDAHVFVSFLVCSCKLLMLIVWVYLYLFASMFVSNHGRVSGEKKGFRLVRFDTAGFLLEKYAQVKFGNMHKDTTYCTYA